MENEYPQILFWKWDQEHLDNFSYRSKIDDIVERSKYDYIYWCIMDG
jgi:hypothetical protein